jgi:flagellar basal-body rod modification protein FlgD
MSRIPSTLGANATQPTPTAADAINDVDLGVFLNLMIKELQSQDPLNPLDNKDMLAQISQIREVGATDKLTETLESVLLGQNIASATNLIGADVTALSDDNENVQGVVSRVSLEKGVPKLHIELSTEGEGTSTDGEVDAGTHSYRVVWENDDGQLFGIELSGSDAVTTTGTPGVDQSILLHNLPITSGPKQIYRTDSTGTGEYQLVGILNDGSQGSFIDSASDAQRSDLRLTRPFQRSSSTRRMYEVSLKNVSGIRPPEVAALTPDDSPTTDVEP